MSHSNPTEISSMTRQSPLLWFLSLIIAFGIASASGISTPLDLSSVFNIKAASTGRDNPPADFDGSGRAYAAELLPEGIITYDGIEFSLPPFKMINGLDAIRAASQVLHIPTPDSSENTTYQSLHALGAATWTPSGFSQANTGNITFTFADNSSVTEGVIIAPWYGQSPFNGPVSTPWHYANATLDWNETVDYNVTHLHYATVRIPNTFPLRSITLPTIDTFLSFFAITLRIAEKSTQKNLPNTSAPNLGIQSVRSTTKWFDTGNSTPTGASRIQLIEVLLDNLSPVTGPLSSWITTTHTVSLTSSSLKTVIPGTVKRLRSNDQALIRVGVKNANGVEDGKEIQDVAVIISDNSGKEVFRSEGWTVTAGIPLYRNDDISLGTHETPDWWEEAKFGIFIHWGVYSVPAWAPSGQQYAEWYNWQFHNPPNENSPTWVHHLETYGPDVIYDDFIANFTADAWNPDDWTDLFADAGALYFVLVTKHDGFALFDTGNSTNRNSIQLGPKRDLLRELFESAKTRHPELHRGTYFSLPEWFNPAYEPYGKEKFPGRPALYAFNQSCCEPYTGYIPQENFIQDIQRPQMEKLFYEYETEILWCDEDGKSIFPEIAGDWYNYAASQGRQVVRNNRCGANQTDFVTPEYATFAAQLSQKWESSEGMDPFSYGYNSNTSSAAYRNASNVILELVDIVSKGGNFLLDIGPKSDGTIIPEMTDPLREVGNWLKKSGEAIYATRPWFVQSADATATNVRFTQTLDAFYIVALERPNGTLRTSAPVPIKEGDIVTMLGGSGKLLTWSQRGTELNVEVTNEELANVPYAWAFRVAYS